MMAAVQLLIRAFTSLLMSIKLDMGHLDEHSKPFFQMIFFGLAQDDEQESLVFLLSQ